MGWKFYTIVMLISFTLPYFALMIFSLYYDGDLSYFGNKAFLRDAIKWSIILILVMPAIVYSLEIYFTLMGMPL